MTFVLLLVGGALDAACTLGLGGELDVFDAASAPRFDGAAGEHAGDSLPPSAESAADIDARREGSADRHLLPESGQETEPPAQLDGGPDGCDFSGTWAGRLTIDVSWRPQGVTGVILSPGNGQIKQWILTTRVAHGATAVDTTVVCGIALPDFSGTQLAGGETYGVQFPNTMFDSSVLPSVSAQVTLSGSGPGTMVRSPPTAVLLGLALPDAAATPWPATVTTEVDSDNDGKPGVTVLVEQGGAHSPLLVDPLGNRAQRLYLAIRQVTALSATAVDCNAFSGTLAIPQIVDQTLTAKYAIDSHVLGCQLVGDAGDCTSGQTAFADNTQPIFVPSGSTSFTSFRVADTATCDTVRRTLP